MLLTDLRELKVILEIDPDDTREDVKLNLFVEQASGWIEEYLDRPLFYKSRTEFYSGTGSQKLPLKARPVYASPVPTVLADDNGFFGSTSGSFDSTTDALTYGDDFCLQLDNEGSTGSQVSRSGLLIRIGDVWHKPAVRQRGLLSPFVGPAFGNIKITYTAGHTIADLPANIRFACNTLVARMRHFMPTGLELNNESYQGRSFSWSAERKNYLMALVIPNLFTYRNWKFG